MKIKNILLILLSISLFVSLNSRHHTKHFKNQPFTSNLYSFAQGSAEILTKDPKVADECLIDYWKIDQPTVEDGHHEWFKELNESLLKLKDVVEHSIVQVCTKYPQELRNWFYEKMDSENTKITFAKNAQNFQLAPTNSVNRRRHRRVFLENSSMNSKTRVTRTLRRLQTKHWFKVLERQLPNAVEVVLKFKELLFRILDGYIAQQYSQFIECIGKSVQTEDPLNRQLMGFKSLIRFMRKSANISEFLNVFLLMLCNWTQFSDFIERLNTAVNDIEKKRRWNGYGKSFAQLVVTISTAVNFEGRRRMK